MPWLDVSSGFGKAQRFGEVLKAQPSWSEELQVGIGQSLLCASVPSQLVLPWKRCSCTLQFGDRHLQKAEQDTCFTGHLQLPSPPMFS